MYPDKQAPEKKLRKIAVIRRELRAWTPPKTIAIQLGITSGHCCRLVEEAGFFKTFITADEKAAIDRMRAACECPASK